MSTASRLASRLRPLSGERPLVLAVAPRSLRLAAAIAEALDGELDLALVAGLCSPCQAGSTIGAVDESGLIVADDCARDFPGDWLRYEAARQCEHLHERRRRLAPGSRPADACGRTVIVVDDDERVLAMALRLLRHRHPARLIAALPASPVLRLAELEALADQVVCLSVSHRSDRPAPSSATSRSRPTRRRRAAARDAPRRSPAPAPAARR